VQAGQNGQGAEALETAAEPEPAVSADAAP